MAEALGAGHGGAVFVVGEAGVGKSRMAREVAALAHDRGVPVAVGRSVQGDVPAPLRPWAEVALSLTRARALPPREGLGPYAAVLGRLVRSGRRP